ncbi:MAG TPA: SOS response-associated peptidase [Steroidobacteraceae bacterium]
MCGRYILAPQVKAEKALGVQLVRWNDIRNVNVAATHEVPVVRVASAADGGGREGVMMRWGLIPPFLKGEDPKFPTINARIETMEASPAFRGAWEKGQRCIAPAQGFYEWEMVPDAPRQPYFVGLAAAEILPFAALWDRSVRADRTVVESFTIITVPANDKRIPAILRMEDVETWLSGTPEQAKSVLTQFPAERLVTRKVSTRVSAPAKHGNDDARLEAVIDSIIEAL